MINIQGHKLKKLCISDMHFSYEDFINPRSKLSRLYTAFCDYAKNSDADMVINYGDMLNSGYLDYIKGLSKGQNPTQVDQAKQQKLLREITHLRIRPDQTSPERFLSRAYLIGEFAKASACPLSLSGAQIEQDIINIRDHDKTTIDYLTKCLNASNKTVYNLHGNHDCITIDEAELSHIFAQTRGHAAIIRTAHAHSFYQDYCLDDNKGAAPIFVREIFFNPNIHNHQIGGLSFDPYDLAWLEDTLSTAPGHTLVNMHFPTSFDQNPKDRLSETRTYCQSAAMRDIINNAGNVNLVSAGHVHRVLFKEIDGTPYITHPSFHQLPSKTVKDHPNLKMPTGYFQEITLDYSKMQAEATRKRIAINKDDTITIRGSNKERKDFAPKSPFKFSIG